MIESKGHDPREILRDKLAALADAIEANPPPIIGSDIFIHAPLGSHAVGLEISLAGGSGGSGTGQRISVTGQAGQTIIGQRITINAGSDLSSTPPFGAVSGDEVKDTIAQIRDAVAALQSTPISEGWIKGLLKTVHGWGSSALNGICSGVADALMGAVLKG